MRIQAVLFDLDGTLLPMDQEAFVKAYFGALAKKLAPYGYEPKALIDAIWKGTAAMVKNDGSCPNEERFWQSFAATFGARVYDDQGHFARFYEEDFDAIRAVCGYDARAAQVVQAVRARGLRTALATNPIFPAVATQKRIAWAGLREEDFEWITTYENSSCCKPNLDYYRMLLEKLGLAPEEVLMVGNDVGEDMVARTLGMPVFLLTDCLINRKEEPIACYPHGDFDALLSYISSLA